MFVSIGLLLLLGAISAVIVVITPWMVSVSPFAFTVLGVRLIYHPVFLCNWTDWCGISVSSPSCCTGYWCYPSLGFEQLLLD